MNEYIKRYHNYLIIATIVAIFWSWLPFMNVAMISKNTMLATSIAWSVFGVIVLINTILFTRVFNYLTTIEKVTLLTLVRCICIWAFTEWFNGWIIAFVWFGTNGSLDTVFPFASFTPLLMFTPLGYMARIVGYHGLSALFVGLILVTTIYKYKKFRLPMYGLCIVLTLLGWFMYRNANGAYINTTIVAEYINQPQKIQAPGIDLAVLPEYGLDGVTSKTISNRFDRSLPRSFVGSQQSVVDAGQVRNILIFGDRSGYVKEIDKSRLIAGGEYLPYVIEGLLHLTGNRKEIDNFKMTRGVVKGADNLAPHRFTRDLVVGGAVCSSIISTEDYRSLTSQKATVLTNSASLGIFTGSKIFNIQHGGYAKFMSVANARPFLQSSSYGSAFALDHNGNTLARIQPIDSTSVYVKTNHRITPYTFLGEWTVIAGCMLIFVKVLKSLYAAIKTRMNGSGR